MNTILMQEIWEKFRADCVQPDMPPILQRFLQGSFNAGAFAMLDQFLTWLAERPTHAEILHRIKTAQLQISAHAHVALELTQNEKAEFLAEIAAEKAAASQRDVAAEDLLGLAHLVIIKSTDPSNHDLVLLEVPPQHVETMHVKLYDLMAEQPNEREIIMAAIVRRLSKDQTTPTQSH